ncbi:unnamed protein product, partial [Ectocarpus sp. 4 AP-2014]
RKDVHEHNHGEKDDEKTKNGYRGPWVVARTIQNLSWKNNCSAVSYQALVMLCSFEEESKGTRRSDR